ncbi:MAG: hypothetical protein ACRD5H_10845, partial [Nitrososphaerales archaeon]
MHRVYANNGVYKVGNISPLGGSTGRQSTGQLNKNRIRAEMEDRGKTGTSIAYLCARLGLDRKTVKHHLTVLRNEGMVIRQNGRFGLWYPTVRLYSDVRLGARLFGEVAFDSAQKAEILSNKVSLISRKMVHNNTRYFQPRFDTTKDWLERSLFLLSNRIGAFVLFTAIQAVNKKNRRLFKTADDRDFVNRDRKIAEWFGNVVDPRLLLWKVATTLRREYRPLQVEIPPQSSYELNDIAIDELSSAFARLYPELNAALSKS